MIVAWYYSFYFSKGSLHWQSSRSKEDRTEMCFHVQSPILVGKYWGAKTIRQQFQIGGRETKVGYVQGSSIAVKYAWQQRVGITCRQHKRWGGGLKEEMQTNACFLSAWGLKWEQVIKLRAVSPRSHWEENWQLLPRSYLQVVICRLCLPQTEITFTVVADDKWTSLTAAFVVSPFVSFKGETSHLLIKLLL